MLSREDKAEKVRFVCSSETEPRAKQVRNGGRMVKIN
jgi:hypothetical protein